jgi:hypothetical protein
MQHFNSQVTGRARGAFDLARLVRRRTPRHREGSPDRPGGVTGVIRVVSESRLAGSQLQCLKPEPLGCRPAGHRVRPRGPRTGPGPARSKPL